MSTTAVVGVEDYLRTTYRPDCDYVEGVLVQRNAGQTDHSTLQLELLLWFESRRRSLGMRAFPELRIRVTPTRFRIPDVCVVPLPKPAEQVLTTPPHICIEVLSPDDSFRTLQERLDDYLAMGVPNVWVLDATTRQAWHIAVEGYFEALDGILRSHDERVVLPISELFLPCD